MAGGRSNSRRGWRNRFAALALGGGVAAITLLAAVAVLEWDGLRDDLATARDSATEWRDPNTEFDPELGWRPIADRRVELDWGEIRTNQYGYRSDPLRPGATAVAVLGDSVAWGLGVQAAATFAGRLDLAYRKRGWQVSNLAVSGYGLGQSYLWLRAQREALPRLRHVILAICADNDIDDTSANSRYGRRKPLYRMNDGQLALEGVPIARHSLRHWYSDSRVARGLLGRLPAVERVVLARMGDRRLDRDEAYKVIRALLAETRREVAARGGVLHAVLLPSVRDWETVTANYEFLRQAARAAELPLLEPRTLLRLLEADTERIFIDATHLTPRGHEVVQFVIERHLSIYEERMRSRSQTAIIPSS